MYVGAISGVIGSFFYEQATVSAGTFSTFWVFVIPLLCSMAGSLLMGCSIASSR
jgi:simple sugar transport system permease protein